MKHRERKNVCVFVCVASHSYVCVCVSAREAVIKKDRQVHRSPSVRQTSRKGVNYASNDPAMNKPVRGSRAPIRLPPFGLLITRELMPPPQSIHTHPLGQRLKTHSGV